jgi:hypothetical protein
MPVRVMLRPFVSLRVNSAKHFSLGARGKLSEAFWELVMNREMGSSD